MIREFGDDYLQRHGAAVTPWQRTVLAQLAACRRAEMGGHVWKCDSCGAVQAAYNACRNRHCPNCHGAAKARWVESRRAQSLPIPYFQVVTTLPHEMNRLVLANRSAVYDRLLKSSAETVLELAADPEHLGARLGLNAILHTWGQRMDLHPHVHMVLPGGGPSRDGTSWVSCRDRFFLPLRVLGRVFRGKFLAGVKQLWQDGKLKLDGKLSPLGDAAGFQRWLGAFYDQEWVVHCEPPPDGITDPQPLWKYLARYVYGVALSNSRLLSMDQGRVLLRYKDYQEGGVWKAMELQGPELIRRFLLHVLPPRFVRVRSCGAWSGRVRGAYLSQCRALLGVAEPAAGPEPSAAGSQPVVASVRLSEPLSGSPRGDPTTTGDVSVTGTAASPASPGAMPPAEPSALPNPIVPAIPCVRAISAAAANPGSAIPSGTVSDPVVALEPRRCPVCAHGILQEVAWCARPRRGEVTAWLFADHWRDVSPDMKLGIGIVWPHQGWDSS